MRLEKESLSVIRIDLYGGYRHYRLEKTLVKTEK